MLKVKKITDQIVLVSANSQHNLGKTFLRFQEYYESPEWKGKIFTEGQFRAWYSEKYSSNTYEQDWSGFNIPSYVLDPFIKGLFNPLTKEEAEIIDLFRYRTDKFYIIGAQTEKEDTLEHEVCHGLYYTNDKYHKDVNLVLSSNNKALADVAEWVTKKMYHPSVILDEVHAYVSCNSDYLKDMGLKFPEEVHDKLRKIRFKYLPE